MEINQNQVNSNHDFRKLPRSSGDGMESRNSSAEKDIEATNNGLVGIENVSKEDVTMPSPGNTIQAHASGPGETSVIKCSMGPLRNGSAKEHCDVPVLSFKQPVIENPSSDNGANNLSVNVCPGSAENPMDNNKEMLHDSANNTHGPKVFSLERKAECLDLQSLVMDLENSNQKLAAEKEKLSKKLGVQTKVNVDLKKLLVASIGEDITARLEKMAFDKAQFDTTLTNLQTQVEEVSEELGRVSIECDVWRTKFLASSMMTNGLSDIKTTLFMKHRNCQTVLQKLLEEQSDIRQHLRATNRLLQGVHHDADKSKQSTKKMPMKNTFEKSSIIELAHINYNMVEDICVSANPDHFYATMNSSSSVEEEIIPVRDLTPAERLACQVLKSEADKGVDMDLVMQKMGRQYIGNSYASRFLTNNFRVTFDCCDRCTGALKVV